jgi:hypothetical protein
LFDARRCDQDIDAAKSGHGRFRHFVDLFLLGDINGHHLCPSPQCLHTGRRFLRSGSLGWEISDDQVCALFGKAHRGRLSNP